ncbi:MAG: DUF1588 domain-containing protein [Pseudomonadales bacterium]
MRARKLWPGRHVRQGIFGDEIIVSVKAGKLSLLVMSLFVLTLLVPLQGFAEEGFTLDVDGDGAQTPLTDGLLVIRHLFGFTGDPLSQGAVNSSGTRTDSAAITLYLDDNLAALDIDQNGEALPLTDGLLIIRHLFGFTGDALAQSATDPLGARKSSDEISAYLNSIAVSDASSGGSVEEPSVSAKQFFEDSVSTIILANCAGCHKSGGSAQGTPLRYINGSDDAALTQNFNTLRDYIASGNGAKLLSRARGVSHGGGAVLSASSAAYSTLEEFVGLVQSEAGISEIDKDPVVALPSGFFKSSRLLSAQGTLRRASILLLGRNPTAEEYGALSDESQAGLRLALKMLTADPNFHQFLTRAANDRLLTDAFLEGMPLEQSFIESNPNYPIATNAFVEAQAEAGERFFDWPKYRHWRWGLARAPVELVRYIVENDRDYREVLTADYMMMNYAVNDFLNGGAEFSPSNTSSLPYCLKEPDEACIDHRIFKPGVNRGQVPLDEKVVFEDTEFQSRRIAGHGAFIDYPHAGVLNTQAFLNRYPSTETNRNRARARWTYYHFLGVDIEKSAPRTTDPVALADTNNPTLKNPACTVCHQVLDPVAGAFQHFGDVGYYNESWGGLDALPQTYKELLPDPSLSPTYRGGERVMVDGETFDLVSDFATSLDAGRIYYRVSFDNDEGGPEGDRNVFYDRLVVTGPDKETIIEFESLPEDAVTVGCGGITSQGYGQYCGGYVLVPIDLNESGDHLFELHAKGEQYGDSDVQLTVSVDTDGQSLDALGYQRGDTWYKDMREPGYLTGSAPDQSDSLQWVAEQLVADPWFAEASVKFWWPALMGLEVAAAPEVEDDVGFQEKLALFEAQNDYVTSLGARFAEGIEGGAPFNGRDLIVELLLSPWFRADADDASPNSFGDVGTRRLLTPEELESKFYGLSQFYWGSDDSFSEWQFDGRYSHLTDQANILYGGIDSRNVTLRASQMTPVMFNIAEKMALQTACEIVSRDFERPKSARLLFTEANAQTTPFNRFLSQASGSASSTSFEVAIQHEAQLEVGSINIAVSYVNDYYSETLGDRNARFDRLMVSGPDGSEMTIEFETPPEGSKITGCGHSAETYHQLSCNGTISLPFEITVAGNHVFTLEAAGEQAGDDAVALELALIETSTTEQVGMLELKAQLGLMHWKLLGEPESGNETEIDASYALLLESLDRLAEQENQSLTNWPYQSCSNHDWRGEALNLADSNGMKGAWISVLTYLMTDFRFLHE